MPNQTLHQTPDTWAVPAGAGGVAAELVVGNTKFGLRAQGGDCTQCGSYKIMWPIVHGVRAHTQLTFSDYFAFRVRSLLDHLTRVDWSGISFVQRPQTLRKQELKI